MHTGHSVAVGDSIYTLKRQIGCGSNGVVWLAECVNGHRLAVKYWLPWTCRLKGKQRPEGNVLQRAMACTGLSIDETDARVKITTYGPTAAAAQEALHKLGILAFFERERRLPSCSTFCIAGCVDPMPIENGVVVMDLVGENLAQQLPLKAIRERHCVFDTLVTAAMSALTQNRCIPDLKPGNICRDGPSFKVVDVEVLPKLSDTAASQWASYTVPELESNLIATMLANLVITMAQVYGTLAEWNATYIFHHNSKVERDAATVAHFAPECCKAIASVLTPDLTRSMALDTLGVRLTLTP